MAGFPQAPDPVWTSRIREDDDAHINAASHAEPRPGQPELLELDRPQPHLAGDSTVLYIILWLRMAAVDFGGHVHVDHQDQHLVGSCLLVRC